MERKSSLESVVRMPLMFIIPGDNESLESLSAIIAAQDTPSVNRKDHSETEKKNKELN